MGGRVFTYKFSEEPYQFSEAGAMRIPCLPCQGHVFRLIDYVNQFTTAPLKLVDFIQFSPSGNRILMNDAKMKDGNDTRIEELA